MVWSLPDPRGDRILPEGIVNSDENVELIKVRHRSNANEFLKVLFIS